MKMVLDVILHMDETISIYGTVAIFDMKGVTWRHGLQMTPTIIKRYFFYMPMAHLSQLDDQKTLDINVVLFYVVHFSKPKTNTGLSIVGKIIHAK